MRHTLQEEDAYMLLRHIIFQPLLFASISSLAAQVTEVTSLSPQMTSESTIAGFQIPADGFVHKSISPEPLNPLVTALESIRQAPYGYIFFDIGLTTDDLSVFKEIDITTSRDMNFFGPFDTAKEDFTAFLKTIGSNSEDLVAYTAARLAQIVNHVISASGLPTAWVSIRAFVPMPNYDIHRWHMDGYYFTPTSDENLLYKFIITLKGDSTLFYPMERDEWTKIWRKSIDRTFMHSYCDENLIVTPPCGQAALLLGGRVKESAVHSEPRITKQRLTLSIVPCNLQQIEELKKKVRPLF